MRDTSRTAGYSRRSYKSAPGVRPRLSGGRHGNSRTTVSASGSHESRGIVDTLQEMFLASRPKFVGIAYAILRNKEDAEDAVQDAVLSAYVHLRNFEGRSAFTTWFTRIVLNAALMTLRKRTNSRIGSLPESSSSGEVSWTERIPTPQPDPEMACAEGETFQFIDILLGKMSPVLRQSFTMTYYDEMSSREACTLLGVSIGTFKSRVFRARRHLMAQAQRSLVTPIRKAAHSPFSFDKADFQALTARSAEISSPEIAFS
ncbi:MAG TPA: RNA polymerase sigma factor [Candidatus Polarisedimenticolia bacterium]|nr:RNA polymerase sigma factor [Candidatus Polarisedimenticolia bacterium]